MIATKSQDPAKVKLLMPLVDINIESLNYENLSCQRKSSRGTSILRSSSSP